MKRFIKNKKLKYIERFLSEVFTERDDFAIKYLSSIFLYFDMDFTPVPVINTKNASVIQTPISLFVGKKDVFFMGKRWLKEQRRYFQV